MEIGSMSAEELAKSFSTNQNQNQTTETKQEQQNTNSFNNIENVFAKSSEELAKEFEKVSEKTSTDEEAEKNANEKKEDKQDVEKQPTKLDDSFKQGLDRLFKENKLNPYSDGTETGYVVPETFEDVLELIEENKKSWIESSKTQDKEEFIKEVLASKSPAWQFLIQNSNMYEDPADLIPLITAVQNQDYSFNLDPSNEEDQEKIIRASLTIQGLPPKAVEEEVEDLKQRGALQKRSEALKPILDAYNQKKTESVLKEKEAEALEKQTFWNNHYKNLEDTVFKSKDLDGVKLKPEHKQLIASALIPNQELGGLPIYTIIDNLIANGKFTTLSKMVLLGEDEKLFDTYFLTKKAEKKAEGIQKILRQSGVVSNTTEEETELKVKPIKKSSYGFFG